MVDAIKTTVNRLETTKGSPTESRLAQNAGGKAVSAPFADTVKGQQCCVVKGASAVGRGTSDRQ